MSAALGGLPRQLNQVLDRGMGDWVRLQAALLHGWIGSRKARGVSSSAGAGPEQPRLHLQLTVATGHSRAGFISTWRERGFLARSPPAVAELKDTVSVQLS